jgi:hypothetical protein
MKTIISLMVLFALLAGCAKEQNIGLTANDYVKKLGDAGLPIQNIVVYTAENDPNGALGHPHQYISKANFDDDRIEQKDETVLCGGSIEIFNSEADAENRKTYLDGNGEDHPVCVEYSFIKGSVLLRLSGSLTQDQAAEYEAAFMKID